MSSTKVQLPASLKIDGVESLRAALGDAFDSGDVVSVEGSAVDSVDFAGLQALLVFDDHCQRNERTWSLDAASDVLRKALDDVGASHFVADGGAS